MLKMKFIQNWNKNIEKFEVKYQPNLLNLAEEILKWTVLWKTL